MLLCILTAVILLMLVVADYAMRRIEQATNEHYQLDRRIERFSKTNMG
jgi:hypothetical protein